MKIYKHEGSGFWLGSVVIVLAENKPQAKKIIRTALDESGLKDEKVNIVSEKDAIVSVVYVDDGDY